MLLENLLYPRHGMQTAGARQSAVLTVETRDQCELHVFKGPKQLVARQSAAYTVARGQCDLRSRSWCSSSKRPEN